LILHFDMQIAPGTIVGGKVVVEGLSLPEGTVVTVLARGDEIAVRRPPQQEAELLDALDEADREEGISADELFARMSRPPWPYSLKNLVLAPKLISRASIRFAGCITRIRHFIYYRVRGEFLEVVAFWH